MGALTAAKNEFKSETLPLSPYDEKVLQQVVLYGLPMYKPAGAAPTPPAPPTPRPLVTDPTLGLPTASVPIALTQGGSSGPDVLHAVDSGSGRYYEVDGKTMQVQYRPVQPLVTRDVTQPNGTGGLATIAHGALITGLTSVDEPSFTPYYSRPLIDLTENERIGALVADAAFPASISRVNSTVDPAGREVQTLAVVPSRFRPDPATPGRGTQRLFTRVNALVHYSDPTDTDFVAPKISQSSGSVVNGTAGFAVDTDPTAQRVYVLFKGTGGTGSSTWKGIDLVRTPGTDRWTGGAQTASSEIEFFVQAGDASGNWGSSNNKAKDFLGTRPVPVSGPLDIAISGAPEVGGWYTGPVQVAVTGPAGRALSVSLDGSAFVPYTGPVAVTGDGLHTLTVTDGQGNTATSQIPIDLSGPTVTATVTPDVPTGADGWRPGPATVTITGIDGGGSGVDTLTYEASGATTVAETTVAETEVSFSLSDAGTTTVTYSAKDTVGRESAVRSLVVKVDPNAPTVACDGVPADWSASDVSISCTAFDPESGLAVPADASFLLVASAAPSTETADAATNARARCVIGLVTVPAPGRSAASGSTRRHPRL